MHILDKPFVEPFVQLREFVTPLEPQAPAVTVAGETTISAVSVGRDFAVTLLGRVATEKISEICRSRPVIPRDVDRELLRQAGAILGPVLVTEDQRRDLRQGFWEAIPTDQATGSAGEQAP